MGSDGPRLSLSPYKDAPPSIVAPLAKGGRAAQRRGDSSALSAQRFRHSFSCSDTKKSGLMAALFGVIRL